MEGVIDQVSGDLHFGPEYAILTMRPWASYWTSLSLSFLLCKMSMACDLIRLCGGSNGIIALVTIDEKHYSSQLHPPALSHYILSVHLAHLHVDSFSNFEKGFMRTSVRQTLKREKRKKTLFGDSWHPRLTLKAMTADTVVVHFALFCSTDGRPSIFLCWMNKQNSWCPVLAHGIK